MERGTTGSALGFAPQAHLLSAHTVGTHTQRILDKLGVHSRVAVVNILTQGSA